MSEYFPKPETSGANVEVELDLPNYATKSDLENEAGADTSDIVKKLIQLIGKSNADELVPVPVESSKLSDVVKNDVIKNDVCNAKIINIEDEIPDINNLATNTALNAKINEFKNKIPILATTTAINAKTNEVKNKIPNITNIATPTALTAVENKTPDHSKYITTPEFNTLLGENCAARLASQIQQTKIILLVS